MRKKRKFVYGKCRWGKMIVDGFQKVTLLDYPNKVAAMIFTRGCNFRCPFCQNSSLIGCHPEEGKVTEKEIFEYLEKRKNILDGIVISGGEPTLQRDLKAFIQKVKRLGLFVKLDTNGSNPKLLKELIDEKLVDYVAMDIKSSFFKYQGISGAVVNMENTKKSIDLLKRGAVDYEFRTTLVREYHNEEDIENICSYIGTDSKYYLQNFVNSEEVIDQTLHGYDSYELNHLYEILKNRFPNVKMERALS